MKTELDIVEDLSGRLQRAGIPFMLTGSMAMNYYAVPRMTRDIDIVVACDGDNVGRFMAVFEPDYLISSDVVQDAVRRRSMFNLIHLESVIKVDFVVRKDSEYRKVEFDRRLKVAINGFETWIVSLEDLVLSKLLWAKDSQSELQLRDVSNLLKVAGDWEYIDHWASRLGVEGLLRSCADE